MTNASEMMMSPLSRALGTALVGGALSVSTPAQACSCIRPDDVERAARAALAQADAVAELDVGRPLFSERRYCSASGKARPWFRPKSKIDHDYSAHVTRTLKGRVSGPIRLRDRPLENVAGVCTTMTSTCDVGIRPGQKAGPLLLRRIGPGVFAPFDICTQTSFADWYARQRSGRPTAR